MVACDTSNVKVGVRIVYTAQNSKNNKNIMDNSFITQKALRRFFLEVMTLELNKSFETYIYMPSLRNQIDFTF